MPGAMVTQGRIPPPPSSTHGRFGPAPGRAGATTVLWWMGSAFAANAVLAAIVLAVFGAGKLGTGHALQITARFSFLLFWLAYASGGLALLIGPTAEFLRRHGRDFGLAFASAHLVHLGLVVWHCSRFRHCNTDSVARFGPYCARSA